MSRSPVLAAWSLVALACSQEPAPAVVPLKVGSNAETERFVRERIQPLFVTHCFACHAKGKRFGGYSMATYEDLLLGGHDEGAAVVPWDEKASSIMRSIRWEGDSDLNMPPKEKLPQADIDAVARWIAMGAPWPADGGVVVAGAAAVRPPLLGRLHPLIVHLPLAALPLAVLAEAVALVRGGPWRHAAWMLAGVAAIGAATAVLTGSWLPEDPTDTIRAQHETLGWITLVTSATAAALLAASLPFPRLTWPGRIALVAAMILAGATGHLGGSMTYSAWGGIF